MLMSKTEKPSWQDLIRAALGVGTVKHLSQIQANIAATPAGKRRIKTNATWRATVRRTIRQHPCFQPVPGPGRGYYRLVK